MAQDESKKLQEIKYPRHAMFIGPPDSGVLPLLKELTDSAPTPRKITTNSTTSSTPTTTTTTAGLTHTVPLSTRYYTASIPCWLDETPSHSDWKSDFLLPEAAEVIRAIGAWIVVFRKTSSGWSTAVGLMKAIKEVVENAYDGEGVWDGVFLCVGMGAERTAEQVERADEGTGSGYEEWDDEAFELGFEVIDGEIVSEEGRVRNAAGELQGTARLIEALESNEWSNVDDLDEGLLSGLLDDDGEAGDEGVKKDETVGFAIERAQMEREFAGLKVAMAEGGDGDGAEGDEGDEQEQVEELERMMVKMSAARDMSSHLPELERKRLAKRTVDEIMRDLG